MPQPFTPEQVALIQKSSRALAAWTLDPDGREETILSRIEHFASDREAALGMATVARLICILAAGIAGRSEVEIISEMLDHMDAANKPSDES